MSKAHDAVTEMMTSKVDIQNLYKVKHPNLYEKLVLDLSREIERKRDREYVSISWASQVEAAAYFNEHGFVLALDHMLTLRDTTNHKG